MANPRYFSKRNRKNSRTMRRTRRDIEVVELVGRGQALTAKQLQIGAGHPLTSHGRFHLRLAWLVAEQYLDTLPRQTVTEPTVYVLSRRSVAGNQLLQELWGEFRPPRVQSKQLEHLLAVNDVFVRVRRACQDVGYSLAVWQFARELGQLTERLIPDSYFHIQRVVQGEVKTSHFFLEVERARMDTKVLRAKLLNYHTFITSGNFEQRFGTRALRILCVFAAEQQEETLRRRVQESVQEAAQLGMHVVHCTTLRTLQQISPVECLTKPIWYSPRSSEPIALFPATG